MRHRHVDAAEIAPVKEARSADRSIVRKARMLRDAWRRNERGSVAIEFAIIAPVFFFLMFVIAETALVFVAEEVMDNAVFETARLIRTGQAQGANGQPAMSQTDFKNAVCARASVFINCSSSAFYLEVKSYPTFGDMVVTQPVDDDDKFNDPGTLNFGTAKSIVVVRAYYQWPITPVMGHQWPNRLSNGKLLIGSFAAFRNEPFS